MKTGQGVSLREPLVPRVMFSVGSVADMSKIPNPKFQIPKKLQAPNPNRSVVCSFPVDAREDEVQFFRFAIQFARFVTRAMARPRRSFGGSISFLSLLLRSAQSCSGSPSSRRVRWLRSSSRRRSCRNRRAGRSGDHSQDRAESSSRTAQSLRQTAPSVPPAQTAAARTIAIRLFVQPRRSEISLRILSATSLRDARLELGTWNFFGIWNLGFGISFQFLASAFDCFTNSSPLH